MPTFNSNAFIPTQLRFLISISLAVIVVLMISRIVILFWLGPSQIFTEYKADLFSTLIYSIRWDLKVLAILFCPIFLISLITTWHNKLQTLGKTLIHSYAFLVVICLLALTFGNALYWFTYGNPLDVFAFGLFEDDTTEVLKILWKDYHPILFSIIWAVSTYLIYRLNTLINNKINNLIPYFKKWYSNLSVILSYFVILFILARGSVSLFPLMHSTTHASNFDFLNQLSMNAPAHLELAILRKKLSTFATSAKTSLSKKGFNTIESAVNDLLFKGEKTQYDVPLIFKSKSTYQGEKPNIIFVLMEGWSSQIVFDQNQPDHFLGEFNQHIPKGLFYKNFVSTRQGTNRFLESTLANTSFFDLSTSLASNYPFKHSNITTLKNLGFELGFIRGGSRHWYNQGNFWTAQGFYFYWEMDDIMLRYNVDKFSDWGVHDEYGFNFAIEKAQEFSKNDSPYFLLVETTTNHPPHVLPKHYDNIDINSDHYLDNAINKKNTALQIKTEQYMTEQLGRFLTNLENKNLLENTIVIATGDHTMWAFYNYSQTQNRLLAGAVPLYIRLPERIKPSWSDQNITGSHRDIFPTIFELAYPNASYLKTGFDLFDEHSIHAGWHEKGIWIKDDLVSISGADRSYTFDAELKIDDKTFTTSEQMQDYKKHITAIEALIQWQFKKEYEAFKLAQ
ncbi:MAG: sulfatase-like hydrolase/transferase [Saccharospirillaceae bacterium]|nr:sulfatase-like hydrolase/transferase [Pseudomonadales bacterium]NRB80459.1 sulfatase-like hydrolase/transferase [Saccharospirillaceae bacterium]